MAFMPTYTVLHLDGLYAPTTMMLRLKGKHYDKDDYESKEVETSPFLRLPAEIRNQIYRLCLECPSEQLAHLRRLTARNHLSAYLLPQLGLSPSFLATCKQIHAEATPVLYRRNTFCAHPQLLTSLPYLIDKSRPILHTEPSPSSPRHIKKWYVSVRLDCDPGFSKEEVTNAFSGVEELEVEAWQAMFASADLRVLRCFEGIRGVQTARVTGSVGPRFKRYLEACMTAPEGAQVEPWKEDAAELEYDIWSTGNR